MPKTISPLEKSVLDAEKAKYDAIMLVAAYCSTDLDKTFFEACKAKAIESLRLIEYINSKYEI